MKATDWTFVFTILMLVLVLVAAPDCKADIYKTVDTSGRITYTNAIKSAQRVSKPADLLVLKRQLDIDREAYNAQEQRQQAWQRQRTAMAAEHAQRKAANERMIASAIAQTEQLNRQTRFYSAVSDFSVYWRLGRTLPAARNVYFPTYRYYAK